MAQCPNHNLLLEYNVDMKRHYCPWPDCAYKEDDIDSANQAIDALKAIYLPRAVHSGASLSEWRF